MPSYYQFLQWPQAAGSILHQANPVKGAERKETRKNWGHIDSRMQAIFFQH
jgi:hypothetical protein